MDNIHKCLSGRFKARVLLVAQAENSDGRLLDLIKVLEDHNCEVIKCVGVPGLLSQMEKIKFDVILIEENLLDPTNGSQFRPQSFCETKAPVVKISYNENTIDCQYHLLKGNIVMPILELMDKHFRDGMNKLKRPKEEVQHADLPAEENKEELKRRKAGEHYQRMAWRGALEDLFQEAVKKLDENENGRPATGKQVLEYMKKRGCKDISIKQVNSHLQKYRDKCKKAQSGDSNSQMLGYNDEVDTGSEHDTSRHGMKEHSRNTGAPENTINGNLNTASQEHQSLENNIQGNLGNRHNLYSGEYDNVHMNGSRYIRSQGENFENGKENNIFKDSFQARTGTQEHQNLQMPVEATLTIEGYTMGGRQNNLLMTRGGEPPNLLPVEPSNFYFCDSQGMPDFHSLKEFLERDQSPIDRYCEDPGFSLERGLQSFPG